MLAHGVLGFCIWDVLAIAALITVIILFVVHCRNYKKEKKQLEQEQYSATEQ